jgi:response regulator RpfG family c-di-GMP phosphodiesterase
MTTQRKPRVLVVDDDAALCEMLRQAFELEGIDAVEAHHVIESESVLADTTADAIVLDLGLPGIDGVFYCERLREARRTRTIPIVAISGSESAGARALAAGASAFLRKPLDPLQLIGHIEELVGRKPLHVALRDAGRDDAAYPDELRRLIHIGQHQHELLARAYRQTLEALADALESRDFGTSAHSRRVTSYATRIALELAPSLVDDPTLEWGFLLHDVGKIGIPDHVLLKPGPLNRIERACIEKHTLIGEALVAHVPLLQGEGLRVVRSHHERWDGSGYPDGLRETETPTSARVFAVADALDAMTDVRPYRPPLEWEEAVAEIESGRGGQFDPDAVDALAVCEADLRQIRAVSLAGANGSRKRKRKA